MKKQVIVSLSAVAVGIILSACGDDVTKVMNEVSGLEVVASADSLGKCDAAALGKTVFASDENAAYICADSGWVPLSGKSERAECSAEKLSDGSGYKIVCNGDSVSVVKNGSDGKNGEGCSLADNGNGTVSQVCGADTVTLYKAFCGENVYDPEKSFCFGDSLYSCGGKAYDPSKQFCAENSAYDFCGANTYDPSTTFCDSRDTTLYRYVVIGEQAWMAENLDYAYPNSENQDSTSFCIDGDPEKCEIYGRFYTWSAAMDSVAIFSDGGKGCGYGTTCSATGNVRGVCPEGWHLPDTTEWRVLNDFVAVKIGSADSVGYALKSANGWEAVLDIPGDGSDAFGFNALPAGDLFADGTSDAFLKSAGFWSSAWKNADNAFIRYLFSGSANLETNNNRKDRAMSVRCVRDN